MRINNTFYIEKLIQDPARPMRKVNALYSKLNEDDEKKNAYLQKVNN